jgi:hypothetical protein
MYIHFSLNVEYLVVISLKYNDNERLLDNLSSISAVAWRWEILSFSCIFVLYYLILSVDILILDTFGVYRVHSKTHMLVLSVGFCRRIADWSIYDTFMLTSDVNVFRFPTWRLVNNVVTSYSTLKSAIRFKIIISFNPHFQSN